MQVNLVPPELQTPQHSRQNSWCEWYLLLEGSTVYNYVHIQGSSRTKLGGGRGEVRMGMWACSTDSHLRAGGLEACPPPQQNWSVPRGQLNLFCVVARLLHESLWSTSVWVRRFGGGKLLPAHPPTGWNPGVCMEWQMCVCVCMYGIYAMYMHHYVCPCDRDNITTHGRM